VWNRNKWKECGKEWNGVGMSGCFLARVGKKGIEWEKDEIMI